MARFKVEKKHVQMPGLNTLRQNVNAELARFAKATLKNEIFEGRASTRYDRWVNQVKGADETTVKVPGVILYEFHWWSEIIEAGLKTLRDRSPVKTGRFRDSWFAMVNGVVATDYGKIPIGADVILTNNQPYSRKIDVGHTVFSRPHGIVNSSRQDLMRVYGNMIDARHTMITLPGGYILKGRFRKGVRPYSRKKLRQDTMAGAAMKYPSLVLRMRE